MRAKIGAIVLAFAAVGSFARAAGAQSQPGDAATAQGLFDDAKRLMRLGQYADACPKLAESQRLDPGGGTLFALGLCHEAWGKTATAWAVFNDALSEARKSGRSDRESAALEHIHALEPRLTRVRILVSEEVDGLEVRRDGERLGRAQWSTAVPVDPGKHAFEASAPGRRPWASTVMLDHPGGTVDVTVPSLEREATPPVDPSAVRDTTAAGSDHGEAPRVVAVMGAPAPKGSEPAPTRWIAPGVTLGVGVVAAGIGSALALTASSQFRQANSQCVDHVCPSQEPVNQDRTAQRNADVATVMFAASGVAIATSAVLFFVAARSHDEPSAAALRIVPSVGRSGFGLAVAGGL